VPKDKTWAGTVGRNTGEKHGQAPLEKILNFNGAKVKKNM